MSEVGVRLPPLLLHLVPSLKLKPQYLQATLTEVTDLNHSRQMQTVVCSCYFYEAHELSCVTESVAS